MFSVFLIDFSTCIPPRSGDLRNTRFVLSWSHLDEVENSGRFYVGQVPGTSHVATRPKKHTCERRIRSSLSRPFAAGPASSLFVDVQSVLDVIRIPGTTAVASPVFPPYFMFLSAGSLKKKSGTEQIILFAADCCSLLLNFRSFSRFFLCQVYAPGPHGDRIVSTKQPIT